LAPNLRDSCDHQLALDRRGGNASLQLGAQPANLAATFLFRTFSIERG
jgi:hypothetical protein